MAVCCLISCAKIQILTCTCARSVGTKEPVERTTCSTMLKASIFPTSTTNVACALKVIILEMRIMFIFQDIRIKIKICEFA